MVFELLIGGFFREKFGSYFVNVGCRVELYMEVFSLMYYFLVDLCVGVVFESSVRCVVIVFFDIEGELKYVVSFFFILNYQFLIDFMVLNLKEILGLVGFGCCCYNFSFLCIVVCG